MICFISNSALLLNSSNVNFVFRFCKIAMSYPFPINAATSSFNNTVLLIGSFLLLNSSNTSIQNSAAVSGDVPTSTIAITCQILPQTMHCTKIGTPTTSSCALGSTLHWVNENTIWSIFGGLMSTQSSSQSSNQDTSTSELNSVDFQPIQYSYINDSWLVPAGVVDDASDERFRHASVYLPQSNTILSYGGISPSQTVLNSLSLVNIQTETSTAVSISQQLDAVYDHAMVYVSGGYVLSCFGTFVTPDGGFGAISGCTVINTNNWALLRPSMPARNSPPVRTGVRDALIYMPGTNNLLLFGGGVLAGDGKTIQTVYNDVWIANLGIFPIIMQWQNIQTSGIPPASRMYHTVMLVAPDLVAVWGGLSSDSITNEVFFLNTTTWTWSSSLVSFSDDVDGSNTAIADTLSNLWSIKTILIVILVLLLLIVLLSLIFIKGVHYFMGAKRNKSVLKGFSGNDSIINVYKDASMNGDNNSANEAFTSSENNYEFDITASTIYAESSHVDPIEHHSYQMEESLVDDRTADRSMSPNFLHDSYHTQTSLNINRINTSQSNSSKSFYNKTISGNTSFESTATVAEPIHVSIYSKKSVVHPKENRQSVTSFQWVPFEYNSASRRNPSSAGSGAKSIAYQTDRSATKLSKRRLLVDNLNSMIQYAKSLGNQASMGLKIRSASNSQKLQSTADLASNTEPSPEEMDQQKSCACKRPPQAAVHKSYTTITSPKTTALQDSETRRIQTTTGAKQKRNPIGLFIKTQELRYTQSKSGGSSAASSNNTLRAVCVSSINDDGTIPEAGSSAGTQESDTRCSIALPDSGDMPSLITTEQLLEKIPMILTVRNNTKISPMSPIVSN